MHTSGGNQTGSQPIELVAARADFSQANWMVENAIDGDRKTGWAIAPEFHKPHWAIFRTAETCGSKFLTTQALIKAGVRTPRCFLAFTPESALEAMDQLGYPCVIKPTTGSWGRLISKINDRDAAEAVLEHKQILGSYHHSIFYIQEYVPKKGKDIRSFVVGGECIAAIYRHADHWITNTARGGKTTNCPITPDLEDISIKAARACGGGVVAIDVFENDAGYSINEVNYTMEFRNSIDVTGVNIPARIVDYILEVGRK